MHSLQRKPDSSLSTLRGDKKHAPVGMKGAKSMGPRIGVVEGFR